MELSIRTINPYIALNAETGKVISELATEAKPVGRLAFSNDSLFVFLQNASERVGTLSL